MKRDRKPTKKNWARKVARDGQVGLRRLKGGKETEPLTAKMAPQRGMGNFHQTGRAKEVQGEMGKETRSVSKSRAKFSEIRWGGRKKKDRTGRGGYEAREGRGTGRMGV